MAEIVAKTGKDTAFFLRIPAENGRNENVNLKSMTMADATLAAEKEMAERGSVDNLFKRYIARLVSEGCISIWRISTVKEHVNSVMGERLAASITLADVNTYIRLRRADGISDTTIFRVELAYLIAAFKAAGLSLPMPDIRVRQRIRDVVLEQNVIAGIFEVATGWFLTFLMLAVHTGGRRSAILRLKWRQVDWLSGTLNLEDKQDVVDRRKTVAEVKMSPTLVAYLRSLGPQDPDSNIVQVDGKPVKYRSVQTANDRLRKLIECPKLTPHVIRHSMASHMLMGAVPLKEVSKWLGHQSESVTEKVYAKFLTKRMDQSANFLDGFLRT